jgi:septal ring factor EnvC (AmiA/AmiB activator)
LNALYELEEHISLTSRLVQAINGQIAQLSDSISRAEQLIADGEEEIATLKRNLSERFVHIYKQRRASTLELILTAQDWHQASYRGKYLRVAADYDRFLTDRVKTEIARLEARKLQLARDRDQQSRLLAEKELEERDLQRNKEKRRRQITQIKKDRRQDERLLLQKKQAAVQMERIIKSLLFDRERRAAELTAIRAAREDEEAPEISFYKGRLPWPTVGTVVSRFGRHRNPKTGTVTESPGIDIQGRPGGIVSATLSGLITTITYIRGYGTTVIIDHGKDLYTVYALLEDVEIAEGQYVDQGQIIAHVGSNSSLEGSKLHFEVWTNQLKQNPEDWLSKPLARR